MEHMDLVETWAKWTRGTKPPYLLDGDDVNGKGVVTQNWREAICKDDYCAPDDKCVHLGLLPHPFCGDVLNAKVYILMLNPGLNPSDYFGEDQVPSFREAVLRNLRQQFAEDDYRFMFLDPQYSWHSGFDWWHGKLKGVIAALAGKWHCTFAEARKRLARSIASIELFPYHSVNSGAISRWLKTGHPLRSAKLAGGFVREYVMPRVKLGEAIIVVTRKAKHWDVKPSSGKVIVYSGGKARGAHLTPGSDGGKAIIGHLGNHTFDV